MHPIETNLERTAKDYDMDIADVERIAREAKDISDFYSALEAFIKARADA